MPPKTQPNSHETSPPPVPADALEAAYRVTGTLGGHGGNEVLLATETQTHARRILKLVAQGQEQEPNHFEARALCAVEHPNLVRVRYAGPITIERQNGKLERRVGFVMDYDPGMRDLATQREAAGVGNTTEKLLSARRAAGVAKQIFDALDALHNANHPLVHRDLSLANVLTDGAFQRVAVCDFGLARFFKTDGTGEPPAGTPAYMSPEALIAFIKTGKSDLTSRHDVWSATVILYELLTNDLPFPDVLDIAPEDADEIYNILSPAKLLNGKRLPSEINPTANTELDEIVLRGFDTNPDARPRAREMAADLEKWLEKNSNSGSGTVSRKSRISKRVLRVLLAAIAGAAIITGGVAGANALGLFDNTRFADTKITPLPQKKVEQDAADRSAGLRPASGTHGSDLPAVALTASVPPAVSLPIPAPAEISTPAPAPKPEPAPEPPPPPPPVVPRPLGLLRLTQSGVTGGDASGRAFLRDFSHTAELAATTPRAIRIHLARKDGIVQRADARIRCAGILRVPDTAGRLRFVHDTNATAAGTGTTGGASQSGDKNLLAVSVLLDGANILGEWREIAHSAPRLEITYPADAIAGDLLLRLEHLP
ncbi:MAG: serine/threonine protein kinase [Puniceicoccales bacterium]|jgi:serine/threonine protein kinase|nr:serine/threonine protein kinase [Puniceicoccales bacterium]